ncbi:MAG: lysine exporter LysO family protein [Candidatus Korarchaeota archaeon]|nr:lysine exporter LysO family protein [Candidatus Korarchaeota archaeon]NIU84115.1 LysO family transporter [Candidatus Thorarchaeota archaeon]NIW14255.1 LysO family transporter [Candidatus Thorarchaeota archaeon]NIW52351.1 LysO family transporter [Candidatus Korarchaeota archaeon]
MVSFEFSKSSFTHRTKKKRRTLPILVGTSVIGGIVGGYYILPTSVFSYLQPITTYALALLLLAIGIDLGMKKETLKETPFYFLVLTIPFLIAVGSIVGAVIAGRVFGMPLNEAAAVGAGFGWYSLSGILLTELYSVDLGLLAFLSNLMRELIAMVICPFVVKYMGKVVSIAPGGATTMDVTLPIIKESAGEEVVIPAFISGAVLTALVPLLIPVLIEL